MISGCMPMSISKCDSISQAVSQMAISLRRLSGVGCCLLAASSAMRTGQGVRPWQSCAKFKRCGFAGHAVECSAGVAGQSNCILTL